MHLDRIVQTYNQLSKFTLHSRMSTALMSGCQENQCLKIPFGEGGGRKRSGKAMPIQKNVFESAESVGFSTLLRRVLEISKAFL